MLVGVRCLLSISSHNQICEFVLVNHVNTSLRTVSGTVTSWLPMTTQLQSLPSPAVCSGAIYSAGGQAIAFDPVYSLSISSLNCLPTEATIYYLQNTIAPAQGDLTQTSLGPFTCPDFYTTAFTSAKNSLSTFVGCCPR
jgi:hypothetical protein